jgi:trigger factor
VHVEVSETGAPPELRAALVGAGPGEEREVTLAPPEGQGAEGAIPAPDRYRVTVRALRVKVLPPLDDELAKDFKLETLAQLREQIRADLERRATERAGEELREAILRQLVEAHPFPIPDILVREEQTHLLEMMVASLARQGLDPNRLDWDWDARRAEMREPAERRVRADLLLDAVAAKEALAIGEEEILAALRQEAERSGSALPALRARLEREGRLEVLKLKMLRAKSLDLIVRSANITDNLSPQAGERA